MKNFMSILRINKFLAFSIMSSIIIILAILIAVFEPFSEIPFIYNQF
ncbi:hypothetical protein CBU03nite_05540 [Clostridium butyricum]|nr:hypothetical protein Cbu04g_05930 [Clostridium butyricum]GEQ24131.1 hypothetical protein CBU03nite_05540 [Clostridium butyricum]